jgi:hypothetical protein
VLRLILAAVRLALLWVVCWLLLVLESWEMLPLKPPEFVPTLAITPTIANTNLNTPNKTTTIVGSNLQVNVDNTDNGQININSQNFNILDIGSS